MTLQTVISNEVNEQCIVYCYIMWSHQPTTGADKAVREAGKEDGGTDWTAGWWGCFPERGTWESCYSDGCKV